MALGAGGLFADERDQQLVGEFGQEPRQLGGAIADDLFVDAGERGADREAGRLRQPGAGSAVLDAVVEQLGEAAEVSLEAARGRSAPTAASSTTINPRRGGVGGEPARASPRARSLTRSAQGPGCVVGGR